MRPSVAFGARPLLGLANERPQLPEQEACRGLATVEPFDAREPRQHPVCFVHAFDGSRGKRT